MHARNGNAVNLKNAVLVGVGSFLVRGKHGFASLLALERSMAPGFAGVENPLFFNENTRMIFGDAKQTLQVIVTEFKAT